MNCNSVRISAKTYVIKEMKNVNKLGEWVWACHTLWPVSLVEDFRGSSGNLGTSFWKRKAPWEDLVHPFHCPSVFRFILFVCLFVLRGNRENCKPATWKQMKAMYVKHITPRKGIRILECRKIFAVEYEILAVGIRNPANNPPHRT